MAALKVQTLEKSSAFVDAKLTSPGKSLARSRTGGRRKSVQSNKAYYVRMAVQEELRAAGAISEISRQRHSLLARMFRARIDGHAHGEGPSR